MKTSDEMFCTFARMTSLNSKQIQNFVAFPAGNYMFKENQGWNVLCIRGYDVTYTEFKNFVTS